MFWVKSSSFYWVRSSSFFGLGRLSFLGKCITTDGDED